MTDEKSFGPFGLLAEIVIVALGALGVAAMFQDYAYFYSSQEPTLEKVVLKYSAVIIGSIVYTISIRQRRKNLKSEK